MNNSVHYIRGRADQYLQGITKREMEPGTAFQLFVPGRCFRPQLPELTFAPQLWIGDAAFA